MLFRRQKSFEKLLISIIFLFILSNSTKAQNLLEEAKITDKIQILVPSRFNAVQLQDVKFKDIDPTTPLAVFSNENRTAELNLSVTRANLGDDLEILSSFYKSNLYALYDSVNVLNDEIISINEREFIRLEFIGMLFPDENSFRNQTNSYAYSMIQYTPLSDRMLIISLSARNEEKSRWRKDAEIIMNSIKIKK